MKRLFLPSAIIVFAVMTVMPAFATERYFSFGAGAWLPGHISSQGIATFYQPGWSTSRTVGIALDNGLRLENEFVWRQASAKSPSNEDTWALG